MHQRHPSPPASSRSLPAVALSSIGLAWLSGCAGLLGIEEATCDPAYDAGCTGQNVGMLMGAGAGGASALAGAGGGAGAAGAGGSANMAGAGGGASGGGGAGGGAPGMEEAPLCERYCQTVAVACTGDNRQYASLDACEAVCELLAPGQRGQVGNTVECRLELAELARATGEPESYCYSAGPGGGGTCGTDCEGFCAIMGQACSLMGSYEECLPLCGEVPNLADDDEAITYNTSITSGNSLQCRLYHVSAATLDSAMHCPHAAGAMPCIAQ